MSYTFGAEEIMAALGITGADFEVQEAADESQRDHANTKTNVGQVVAASEQAFNLREEKTITVKSKNPDGADVVFTLGGAGTGAAGQKIVVTQFQARSVYNENGTLTVTAHKHDDTEAGAAVHLAAPVAQSVTVTLGFGVAAVRLGGTLTNCQRAELSGQVRHVDEPGNKGQFLVGASTELVYNASEEYVDNGAAITVPAPWKQDTQRKNTTSEGFWHRTVAAHAYSLT